MEGPQAEQRADVGAGVGIPRGLCRAGVGGQVMFFREEGSVSEALARKHRGNTAWYFAWFSAALLKCNRRSMNCGVCVPAPPVSPALSVARPVDLSCSLGVSAVSWHVRFLEDV